MKPYLKIIDKIGKNWNNEELIFKIGMGLKFLGVSFFCLLSVLLFTYLLIRIDLIFFVSHGFPGADDFQNAFYSYIYSSFIDGVIWIAIGGIFTFGLGYYLSGIMIRPFKAIGTYCEDKMNNKANLYTPDFFSDLKLLTSFSIFFFSKIDESETKKKLVAIDIPLQFTRIHKPRFERNYFINYLFIIAIFALLSTLGIVLLNIGIREHVTELARKFLAHNNEISYFLDQQFLIANIAVYFFMGLHLFLYFLLGIHLYSKVAAPAFAVFATMRSFLRGNHHNRVHLIGYYYLRNDCRKINKYLDHIQKNLT
jgi:hypothetical protein